MSQSAADNAGMPAVALRERAGEQAPSSTREHVAYIEYFRAVAIMLIVVGHTYILAWSHFADEDPQFHGTWLNILPALISGGTAYFVFISGFLYRQVFHGRVSYGDFMSRKALAVGLPYLLLSTPLILAEIGLGSVTVTVVKDGEPLARNLYIDYLVMLGTGRMVTAYWYIPFVFLVFAASPLFDRFIRLLTPQRVAVFALSVGVAMWVVRPVDNMNPVHSLLYFTNFYLFGILFCENRRTIMAFLTRPAVIAVLAAGVLGVAAVQATVVHLSTTLERLPGDGWAPVGFDWMLVQKYLGIPLLCGVLARWGGLLARPLSFVAGHSFGLFFTHGIVIAILNRMPQPLSPHIGEPVVDLALYSMLVLATSMTLVLAVKQIAGRYSRYLIGC